MLVLRKKGRRCSLRRLLTLVFVSLLVFLVYVAVQIRRRRSELKLSEVEPPVRLQPDPKTEPRPRKPDIPDTLDTQHIGTQDIDTHKDPHTDTHTDTHTVAEKHTDTLLVNSSQDPIEWPSSQTEPLERPNTDLQNPGILASLLGVGCFNTKQGRELLADNYGSVCHRNDINRDGCCAQYIDRYSCKTCRSDVKCCTSYEYCVSCCVGKRLPLGRVAVSKDSFALCIKDCRTSSRSTRHGNEYKHQLKYCYETDDQTLANLVLGVNATTTFGLANVSVSCGEACAAMTPAHVCSEEIMEPINSCEQLQQHFPCETGCQFDKTADTPSYVLPRAKLLPGMCLVNEKNKGLDCNGRSPNARRLCRCLRATSLDST